MKKKTILILSCMILIVLFAATGCRPAERPVPEQQQQGIPADPAVDPRTPNVPGAPGAPGEPMPPVAPVPGGGVVPEEPMPEERLPGQPADPARQPGQAVTPR